MFKSLVICCHALVVYENMGTFTPCPASSISRPNRMEMPQAIEDRCFCNHGCSLMSALDVVPAVEVRMRMDNKRQ